MALIRAEHTPRRHPEQDPGQRLLETGTEVMGRGVDSVGTRQHAPAVLSHPATGSLQGRVKCWPENPITSAWKPLGTATTRAAATGRLSLCLLTSPALSHMGKPLPRAQVGSHLVSVSQSQGSVKVKWFLPCHQLSSTDKLWP